MIYIIGVTILSKVETTGAGRNKILTAFMPIGVVITVVTIFSLNGYFPSKAPLLFLLPFIFLIIYHFRKVFINPVSANIQGCVKVLILLIVLLDAMFLSGFKGLSYGLIIVLLLIPSVASSRLIYIT